MCRLSDLILLVIRISDLDSSHLDMCDCYGESVSIASDI